MSVASKTREGTASVTREHKFLGGDRGNLCVEEFDEILRLQSEKREEFI